MLYSFVEHVWVVDFGSGTLCAHNQPRNQTFSLHTTWTRWSLTLAIWHAGSTRYYLGQIWMSKVKGQSSQSKEKTTQLSNCLDGRQWHTNSKEYLYLCRMLMQKVIYWNIILDKM